MWGALALAGLAFFDPIKALQDLGLMSSAWVWDIGPEQRRAILLALMFVWMLGWYHRKRIAFEDRQPVTGDMPLHLVARYIARDSKWAADYAWPDDDWVTHLNQELMSKLRRGQVQALGRMNGRAEEDISRDFLRDAEWHSFALILGEHPPDKLYRLSRHGGGTYENVMFNRHQVERTWPKRSFHHRLKGKSPIDRINRSGEDGYSAIFAKQDRAYGQGKSFYQSPSLQEILEE